MQRLAEIFTKSPLKVFAKSDIIIWVMRANMGKTPIIIEMSKLKESMKKQKITRRILAAFCVVCIALLQCFVLMPAASDEVYADGSLDLTGYADGNEYNKDFSDSIDGTISELMKKANVDPSGIDSIGSDEIGELKKDDRIKKKDGKYYIIETVEGDEGPKEIETQINSIDFTMKSSYSPVKSISIEKIGDVKAGSTKTLKYGSDYNVNGDSFFEGDGYSDFIDVSVEGADSSSINNTSIEFTAGKSGTTVKVTIKANHGGSKASGSANVVPSALSVSPSSVTLTVGESKTCSVKADGTTVSNSDCSWSSTKGSVASVSSGMIRALKAGKTTVKVKYNGLTAKVSVTVKEKKTSSTTRYTRSTYRPTYHTYRPTRSSNTIRTSGTGATRPTTATRPTETVSTAAPSFQTMKVKEVYLTPVEQDPYGGDEFGDEFTDDGTDENMDDENYDEDGVTFPAAAGSAAVAVAACGAGAVGRVRKFHIDMGDISSAKDIAAGGDGGMGGDGQSAEATGDAGEGEGKSSEKRSRNPLKKFRK